LIFFESIKISWVHIFSICSFEEALKVRSEQNLFMAINFRSILSLNTRKFQNCFYFNLLFSALLEKTKIKGSLRLIEVLYNLSEDIFEPGNWTFKESSNPEDRREARLCDFVLKEEFSQSF